MEMYITLNDVILRLLLAATLGGIIGIEREHKRKPAGFTTHILICMGAAITTLTSQFLVLNLGYYADITRLGAQVIAGIGFIGTGTIIVSKGQRIKGLTTAAGLWTCAIIGLTTGAGLYDLALIAVFFVMLIELPFAKIEHSLMHKLLEVNLMVEYNDKNSFSNILDFYRSQGVGIHYIEFLNRTYDDENHRVIFFLRLNNKITKDRLLMLLKEQKYVKQAKIIGEGDRDYSDKHLYIT